ncbi:MAG TPA: hypothetical protein VHY84_24800 [Bryobacteraceae bacterium]|jgi:hypothetical protein|nr:hypothetical protein [Bryobacteraceae bacterium]
MFDTWFGKNGTADLSPSGSDRSGNGNGRSTEHNDSVKRLISPGPVADWPDRPVRKPNIPPNPPSFEQIYQTAAVKPPKIAYGIHKVAEMGNSAHLAGMSPTFKRKALLMALEAAGTDVGEVLNDVVARQRALKEYEESYLEKVSQFEAVQMEQNRLQKAELDRITSQFKSRMDAGMEEVERWHDGFREWQKNKQQELQRLTDAAGLCVSHEKGGIAIEDEEEEESDGKVMTIAQRAGGAGR